MNSLSSLADLGELQAIRRYPVKSLRGEALTQALVTPAGIAGDRAWALQEVATGLIASAKHPRQWAALLSAEARWLEPGVEIVLPDGETLHSDQPDHQHRLTAWLGREVRLLAHAFPGSRREAERGAAGAETIQQEPLGLAGPSERFFDVAPLHLLTTSTLAALQALYPGDFDPRRFRPNLLLRTEAAGFVEQAWLGRTLSLGELRLEVIDPTPRCVMTTLAQSELPTDTGILKTLASHTSSVSLTLAPGARFPAVAGVYARVISPGVVALGDRLRG